MSRMIDLVKQSAVPASVMRSAANGALSLPAAEMVEILVHLTHNHLLGNQARLTLAGWDGAQLKTIASDPQTAPEVLAYLADPRNARPNVVAALAENPAVIEAKLRELAAMHDREVLAALANSTRVRRSPQLLSILAANPYLDGDLQEGIRASIASSAAPAAAVPSSDPALEQELAKYTAEHHGEIQAEYGRPFELVESTADEQQEIQAALHPRVAIAQRHDDARLTPIQKIGRLNVKERVQLAIRGNKDDRFVLIRDSAKVVALAVIDSAKLSEQEVETFAAMKNVQEVVLRTIAAKRKFIKLYPVTRALANNPRTPLDVALPLLKGLLLSDLKNLAINKNIADTLRKTAEKLAREKTDPKKRSD